MRRVYVIAALLLCGYDVQASGVWRALDVDKAVDGDVAVRDTVATAYGQVPSVGCKVGDWKIVQDCGVSSSNQIAQRSIITAPSGKGAACPPLMESRPCTPVDCVATWGPWEPCGADGYKFRIRSVAVTPLYGGRACLPPLGKSKCSTSDCLVSPWSDWACNATTGSKTRSRAIVREPTTYGAPCPSLQETKSCDPVDCQIKTVADDTSAWSMCQFDGSTSGYQTKVLGINTQPMYNGTVCPSPTDPRRIAAQACQLPAVVPGSRTRNLTAVVDILAYSDVYEMTQDTVNGLNLGGPSRVVPVAKAMKAKNSNSLVLFSGDSVSPSLWSLQFKGMQLVDAHNAIGVDFASLGNHEFDYGLEAFWNVTSASTFPWLNANCYELETKALLRGTTERAIKEFNNPSFGKIKVGLFGIMYDMKDPKKGLYWTDPIEAANTQVAALKAAGVDMIIALTHQELGDDSRLSKEVPGITLIYGGHDHSSMLQSNFGTPYLKADFDFRSIWKSHIEFFAGDTKIKVPAFRMEHTAVPITQEMPTDPALDAIIDSYAVKIGTLNSRVVGTLCQDLELLQSKVRTQDMPIGHVFTDAILAFNGPGSGDAVVQNAGAIRLNANQTAGSLTFGQLEVWSPFGNTIQIVQTNGASLKKYLTHELVEGVASSCSQPGLVNTNGMYVHTAGIKYVFTCTGPKSGSVTSLEWSKHPTRNGTVGDTETFKLVMNDFLYSTEFTVIPGVNYTTIIKAVEARRVDNALETYIKSLENATLCENDRTVRSLVVPLPVA